MSTDPTKNAPMMNVTDLVRKIVQTLYGQDVATAMGACFAAGVYLAREHGVTDDEIMERFIATADSMVVHKAGGLVN